jgi:hypothetical protein
MIRPKPSDLLALIINHLRTTVGLMNISSLIEPIRGSEVPCPLDAGVGVDLLVFRIPFGLQRHVDFIVVLQSTQAAVLRLDAMTKMIVLGLEVLGSGNSLKNRWILREDDAPYLCCAARDGATTNFALVAHAIKAR